MADIVERLRALVALRRQAGLHKSSDTEACWLEEAADEIERLRAERPPAPPEARDIAEAALTYALRDHRDPPTALGPSDHQSLQLAFAAGARWVIERAAAQQVTPEMVSRAARVLCEVTCAAYPCRECSPGSDAFDLASSVLTAALAPPAAKEAKQIKAALTACAKEQS